MFGRRKKRLLRIFAMMGVCSIPFTVIFAQTTSQNDSSATPNNLTFLIAFIFPVVFAGLEFIVTWLINGKSVGDRKYIIHFTSEDNTSTFQKWATFTDLLDLVRDRHESVTSVKELDPPWYETNLSITLMIAAISAFSANMVSGLVTPTTFLFGSDIRYTWIAHGLLLLASIGFLFAITCWIDAIYSVPQKKLRRLFLSALNIMGVLMIFMSYHYLISLG